MKSLSFLFVFLCGFTYAQKPEYSVLSIPQNLKENANAVVRLDRTDVSINSRTSLSVHTEWAITVFNERGFNGVNASEYRHIKSIGATIYDASGNEIKRLKRKDFREVSASEGSLISDDRVTYLDYTPTQYPFTIVYESEIADGNTAFLPDWYPIAIPLASVEKSEINVTYPSGLGFKFKEKNFGTYAINKVEKSGSISYSVTGLPAIKDEQYSPSYKKLVPYVLFGLDKFNLEGVEGEATSWQSFGLWMQKQLLDGRDELPEETKSKIKNLVGNENDPIKKARIVYEFVQNKTRYVSIQLGIGGWKPMKASDVDRLGYGDCKALTNYTKALLEVVGVPSYYAIIYADESKIDMEPDFVSVEGNHATLAIPDGNKLRWVECTSQTAPFDFQANWTDDRFALVIKPEGGELVRTNIYKSNDNCKTSVGKYSIDENGSISGEVEIKSRGTRYTVRERELDRKSAEERTTYYKNYFSQINNLKLTGMHLENDKLKMETIEKISVSAGSYGNLSSNRLMFAVNAFNPYTSVPQRYRTRNNPLEIQRGSYDEDDIVITLPEGFTMEAKPDNVTFTEVFGSYKAEYTLVDNNHIRYKRSLIINEGTFAAAEYDKFRKFCELVSRSDNAKCVLIKQ